MAELRRRILPILLAALAAGLAWIPRAADPTLTVAAPGGWFSSDADTAYQARRVERVLREGLPVAESDPLLNHPDGALVPWPPYYTLVLAAALAPFAPAAPAADARTATELAGWVERRISVVPLVCGLLTAALAALAAWRLGGAGAALFAGATYAATGVAIAYARLGNGDHHALVSLLHGLALALFARALARGDLHAPRRAATSGAAVGALLGLALGAWVAALVYVVLAELVLLVLLLVHARRPLAGWPHFVAALHVAALAAVLPAVLSSPWKAEQPWIVVNLSWFHAVYLALGALAVLPLLVARSAALRRAYPALLLGALALGALILWIADAPLARAVGAGFGKSFAWLRATDPFMAEVAESRPLLGPRSDGLGRLVLSLGVGALLAPLVLASAVVAAVRGRHALWPWIVAVALLGAQAALQYRFAEALALPLSVLLGWAAAAAAEKLVRGSAASVLGGATLLVLALLLQGPAVARTAAHLRGGDPALAAEHERARGIRGLCEWLRERPEPGGVLASWGFGHVIELAARRGSVATNFGAYVGEQGFRAPARFFLERDDADACALLAERDARFVLVTAQLPRELPSLIREADPALAKLFTGSADLEAWDGTVTPRWAETAGARLLLFAAGRELAAPPPACLRLVHAAPERDARPGLAELGGTCAVGWIYEHVAGARVVAPDAGALVVELTLLGPDGRAIEWKRSGATVRVPYATESENGSFQVERARWRAGGAGGELRVTEEDVELGRTVEVR